MNTYHQRYLANQAYRFPWRREARRIWTELVTAGAAVRDAPLIDDARAVATAMMERARANIERLVPRLLALGYRFAEPDRAWIPPNPEIQHLIDDAERNDGPLPLVVRAWFEVVGSVNFMGAHPRLSSYADLDWNGSEALDGDPLVVDTQLFAVLDAHAHGAFAQLPLAPDATFKTGASGSGTIGILLPNPAFDAPLLDAEARWTGTFFLPYLQTCFAWGGFPGLQGSWLGDRQMDSVSPPPELAVLTQDLLPLF